MSPQLLMLGEVLCKSPDPLCVLRVGRYELWNRDVRVVMAQLAPSDVTAIREYLHFDALEKLEGEKWVTAQPDFRPASGAFARLWKALSRGRFLHDLTPRSRDDERRPEQEVSAVASTAG